MDPPEVKKHEVINVQGSVSAQRIDRVGKNCCSILLMGPTGSGKSTFIESLGLYGTSTISSNGLDEYTQSVSTYRLNNITFGTDYPICLVDSPGFADTKISEMKIVSMVQQWLMENDDVFIRILYFTPITHVRLPGSQRQVLKTFQALTGSKSAQNIPIVTSMWDCLWGENAVNHAKRTYQELQNDVWKDFIEQGARIDRFHNTKDSALSIIDTVASLGTRITFSMEDMMKDHQNNRIQNLQSQIDNLRLQLGGISEECTDELLRAVLLPKLEEAEEDLERFQHELREYGPAPHSPSSVNAPGCSSHNDHC